MEAVRKCHQNWSICTVRQIFKCNHEIKRYKITHDAEFDPRSLWKSKTDKKIKHEPPKMPYDDTVGNARELAVIR